MTVGDKPAYATGDLLTRHPTNPELWRAVGRKDDQIMHSNGEKTNPGPIGEDHLFHLSNSSLNTGYKESAIMQHPAVGRVLMFGRERFNPGIIIESIEKLTDEESRISFIDAIW